MLCSGLTVVSITSFVVNVDSTAVEVDFSVRTVTPKVDVTTSSVENTTAVVGLFVDERDSVAIEASSSEVDFCSTVPVIFSSVVLSLRVVEIVTGFSVEVDIAVG